MNQSIKFVIAVITILFGISLITTAQAETKQPGEPPMNVTTQKVTTDDGRKAILKSNGTWKYANEDSLSTKAKSTLSIETGLVLTSGDTKPISRTTFYLLDNSLAQILIDASFKNYQGEIIDNKESIYINYFSSIKHIDVDKYKDMYNSAWFSIKPHVVQTVTTGFDGKATFKPISEGKYYLMGYSEISNNSIIWDTEVNLSPDDNFFTLDQNNIAHMNNKP